MDVEVGAASSIKVVIADVAVMVLEVLVVVGDTMGLLIGSVQLLGLVSALITGAVEAVVGITPTWLIDGPLLKEFSRQSGG